MTFAGEVAWAVWHGRRNYDIVYFLMQGLHLASGLLAARAANKPIIMKVGGSGVIPLMQRSRAGRAELEWLRRWAARLMVLNPGMIEEAVAHGFPRERITWMPNPVDTGEFRPGEHDEVAAWRRNHDLPMEAQVAAYVGRLSPEKGLPAMLHGFAHAARTAKAAMLLLVGDGAQRPELEALSRELQLTPRQIRFIGRVDVTEVPFWLRASDVFLLTSPSEGFSCALAEAMASALPSVVSDIPANVQLVEDGVHGLTIPPGQATAIGEALIRLFGDASLRVRMGHAARQRVVDNYSTNRVVDRYEEMFAEVLRGLGQPS
jgi:glycosyltransferase involved in cell wall biosynthesis